MFLNWFIDNRLISRLNILFFSLKHNNKNLSLFCECFICKQYNLFRSFFSGKLILIGRQPSMAVRMATPINQNDESIAVQNIFLDVYT